jgi:hypothetical protein
LHQFLCNFAIFSRFLWSTRWSTKCWSTTGGGRQDWRSTRCRLTSCWSTTTTFFKIPGGVGQRAVGLRAVGLRIAVVPRKSHQIGENSPNLGPML